MNPAPRRPCQSNSIPTEFSCRLNFITEIPGMIQHSGYLICHKRMMAAADYILCYLLFHTRYYFICSSIPEASRNIV